MADNWGCDFLPVPTLSLHQCWNVLEALESFFFNRDLEMGVGVRTMAEMGYAQASSQRREERQW